MLAVQAGSLRLNSHETYKDVAAVKVHPKYKSGGVGYDIAVLRLTTNLKYNANINAIELTKTDPPVNSIVCLISLRRCLLWHSHNAVIILIMSMSMSVLKCGKKQTKSISPTVRSSTGKG